ncbi:MAG: hypothetical protein CMB54_02035 [Euryarchaeota archaeon]|nr:hypothetical protein [Euryarchaeota archaeon]
MIEISRLVLILLGLSLAIYPVITADGITDANLENSDVDSTTYVLMLFAFIGWSFVLVLLGGGVYHAFRHHRNRKEPEKPLRCK